MMRMILSVVLIVTLLSACTEKDTISPIHKADLDLEPLETSAAAESEQWDQAAGEIEDYAEFTIDEEIISLSIHDIPILHQFLQAQENPQRAIMEMELERYVLGLEEFFILRFSCYNEQCSYLLLHPDQNKSAFLVADMASYESHLFSPDTTKVAFHFNRPGNGNLTPSHIVIFDLDHWKAVTIIKDAEKTGRLGFTWPILSFEWVDDSSLAIEFPTLSEPSEEAWTAWNAQEEQSNITTTYYLTKE